MLKDGFYGPKHELNPKTKVSNMTLKEVERLRNVDGESEINPMSSEIKLLKKDGVDGDLETKADLRFSTDKVMGGLAKDVKQEGIDANVKSIDRGQLSTDILEEAQKEGFWVKTAVGDGKAARYIGYGQ